MLITCTCFPVITCLDPGTVPNSHRTGRVAYHYRYDTHVRYTCNTGYELQGSAVLRCEESGRWSAPLPTCQRKYCTDVIAKAIKLPWIFPGASLTFNRVPGNIQGNWQVCMARTRFPYYFTFWGDFPSPRGRCGFHIFVCCVSSCTNNQDALIWDVILKLSHRMADFPKSRIL